VEEPSFRAGALPADASAGAGRGCPAGAADGGTGCWVLLCYRLPREPSRPRIAVWRTLKRLGVAQLADGLVALPADARTRERLEWVAEEAVEAGGQAGIWLARPTSGAQERQLAAGMAAGRAAEYRAIAEQAAAAAGLPERERRRAATRLRVELRRVTRRGCTSTGRRAPG